MRVLLALSVISPKNTDVLEEHVTRCAVEIDSESLARRGSQNDTEESTGIGSFAVRPEGAESHKQAT